jgi:hypothetical protein
MALMAVIKVIQYATGAILVLWMVGTTLFYLANNAFEKENSRSSGHELFVKYTPNYWKRITRWIVWPATILYLITILVCNHIGLHEKKDSNTKSWSERLLRAFPPNRTHNHADAHAFLWRGFPPFSLRSN